MPSGGRQKMTDGAEKTISVRIALDREATGANRKLAQWLLDHPGYSSRKVAEWLGGSSFRVNCLRRWAKGGFKGLPFDKENKPDNRDPSHRESARSQAPLKSNDNSQCIDACDYDWSNPRLIDFGDPSKMYKAQSQHYRREASHLAAGYPLLFVKHKSLITEAEIAKVADVAAAWNDVAIRLRKLRGSK